MRSNRPVPHVLVQLAAGVVLIYTALMLAAPVQAEVGDTAALAGKTVNGQKFDIARWRGKIVIVNFWATWCTPCRAEMPMLSSFAKEHRAHLRLIGVSEDGEDAALRIRRLMQGLDYQSAMLDSLTANSFGHPHLLPVTYVVGPKGDVRAVLRPGTRPLSSGQLWQTVSPLLAKKTK